MKKHLFLLGLAVTAMTSCTNDEVLEQAQSVQETIGFESFINKTTRATVATDVTIGTLKEFYVFGYYGTNTEVFDNALVKQESSVWKVQERKLWTNNNYTFAAYANGVGTGAIENPEGDILSSANFASGTLNIPSYSLADKDLIAAFATQDNTGGNNQSKVELTFRHLLSKVAFKFQYTDAGNEDLQMTVSNVTLTVPTTATCTATSSVTTWSSHTTGTLTTYTNIEGVTKLGLDAPAAPATPASYYVLPNEATMGNETVLSFDVTYTDKTQSDAVVKTDHHDLELNTAKLDGNPFLWGANTAYTYTVQLPFEPIYIDFTVNDEIPDWTTKSPTISPAS